MTLKRLGDRGKFYFLREASHESVVFTSSNSIYEGSEHLRLVLRGRQSTWSTFMGVRGSRATIDYIGRRFGLRGRRSIWGSSSLFCVAGAALGAPPARFAWQVQHLEPLWLVLHGRRSTWSTFTEVRASPATIDCIGRCVGLRGRRSIWGPSGSFCVAGAALGAPS